MSDLDDDHGPRGPQTWKSRNAGTLLGAVLFGLLALVISLQAC